MITIMMIIIIIFIIELVIYSYYNGHSSTHALVGC